MCFARGAVMTSAPRAFAQTLRPTFLACAVAALVACTGSQGPAGSDGPTALSATTAEPPGSHCVHGGTRIDLGVDTDATECWDRPR